MTRPPLPRGLIGVVHLLPLPGAPVPGPGLESVVARAEADARALVEGGAGAAIVENLGDAPFTGGTVTPDVVAAMTRIALAIRHAAPDLELGVNVLRNDASAALAVAAAVGATFIRVNVHTGSMWTDQGLIEGSARETLLERNRLGADVAILADVHVKHAMPVAPTAIADVARDTWHRGGASGLVVTGTGTGRALDVKDLVEVGEAVPNAPVYAGSGVQPDNVAPLRDHIDGAIVGTWLHEAGDLARPLDPHRVARMREALT